VQPGLRQPDDMAIVVIETRETIVIVQSMVRLCEMPVNRRGRMDFVGFMQMLCGDKRRSRQSSGDGKDEHGARRPWHLNAIICCPGPVVNGDHIRNAYCSLTRS
jgi:hypothetical protein